MSPARILDTRGGSRLGPGGIRTLSVDGAGGLPASGISAVWLNVTATNTTAMGFLAIWPAGLPRPPTSNLNWTAGRTVPNLVEVALGVNDQVSFYNSAGSTDLVVDVFGYVALPASTATAGMYNPVAPHRVLDTRIGLGASKAQLCAGQVITVKIAGTAGVPSTGATAVVLNVTAVNTVVAPSFVTVFPAGTPRPNTSNLNFVPGQTVALVGHTGAGKTTIVNLLLRFYDPQRGRITVNGVDIREMPVDELRGLIGYVQQDIFLFAGDITSNIRLSNPLSEEQVSVAAARVGADRIIRRFPSGYAHMLGERGASISVGERQLLSFARAIAADPALLILDEATSAVDSEIEAEIQSALGVLMSGRTTIAIAHRLSTILGADEILVLHHGQVRERGTHRQLMARAGLYERLYRLQTGAASGRVTATSMSVSGM